MSVEPFGEQGDDEDTAGHVRNDEGRANALSSTGQGYVRRRLLKRQLTLYETLD